MKYYSRWNSPENKRKRSEKAGRAALARWDAYHAALAECHEQKGPISELSEMMARG